MYSWVDLPEGLLSRERCQDFLVISEQMLKADFTDILTGAAISPEAILKLKAVSLASLSAFTLPSRPQWPGIWMSLTWVPCRLYQAFVQRYHQDQLYLSPFRRCTWLRNLWYRCSLLGTWCYLTEDQRAQSSVGLYKYDLPLSCFLFLCMW